MRMDQHIRHLIEKYAYEAAKAKSKHEALESYHGAYAQAEELGNAFTLRACAANLGAMYISMGTKEDAQKGVKYLLQAVPPNNTTDCVSNGDLFFNIALGNEVMGRYREAVLYLEKAYEEYREKERDNTTMEINTLKRLVQVNKAREKLDEVVTWMKSLEEIYGSERAPRPKDQLLTMVQRITLQQRLQQEGTEEAWSQCCEMVDSIRAQGSVTVGILVQVSVLLTQFKELKRARKYLEEALELFEAEDSRSLEQAVVLQNLGTVCNYLHDWETSVGYHKQAAVIYQYYSALPPDPKLPIQPQIAQRCQGHCLANHAYALVHMNDVDEGRVLFDKARELANRSGDVDTKWQMDEALGAVHFQMAVRDLDLPQPLTLDTKVSMRESHMEHLEKSISWYKKAVADLANAQKVKSEVMDRVVDKLTKVQAFKANTAAANAEQEAKAIQTEEKATAIVATKASKDDAEEDDDEDDDDDDEEEESSSEEEEEEEEETEGPKPRDQKPKDRREEVEESDDEDEEEEEDDEDDDEDDEEDDEEEDEETETEFLGKTMRRPADSPAEADDEDEEDRTRVNEQYQLLAGTLGSTGGFQHVVKADVHKPQQKMNYSSSASGGSNSDDSSSDDSASLSEGEIKIPDMSSKDSRQREVPPVPTQSPPNTTVASGTYENPRPGGGGGGDDDSGPSRRTPLSGDYAEIDFEGKKSSKNPGTSEDPDYETVRPGGLSTKSKNGASSSKDKSVNFQVGDDNYLVHGSDTKKDSKTCVVM